MGNLDRPGHAPVVSPVIQVTHPYAVFLGLSNFEREQEAVPAVSRRPAHTGIEELPDRYNDGVWTRQYHLPWADNLCQARRPRDCVSASPSHQTRHDTPSMPCNGRSKRRQQRSRNRARNGVHDSVQGRFRCRRPTAAAHATTAEEPGCDWGFPSLSAWTCSERAILALRGYFTPRTRHKFPLGCAATAGILGELTSSSILSHLGRQTSALHLSQSQQCRHAHIPWWL